MKSLSQIQSEVGEWSRRNFGEQVSKATGQIHGSVNPLLGLIEEVGELTHAVLKRHQGIRGYDNDEKFVAERNDAVADVMIYLLDFCSREGIDAAEVLNTTWEGVQRRDWEKNRVNAVEVA